MYSRSYSIKKRCKKEPDMKKMQFQIESWLEMEINLNSLSRIESHDTIPGKLRCKMLEQRAHDALGVEASC